MMLNHYDREYFAQTHRQDLLREAEQQRLAQLSRSNTHKPFFAPLMFSLRTHSIKLRKSLRHRTA